MAKITEPSSWELDSRSSYIPVSYQGDLIGFCKSNVAQQVIDTLNDIETLRKAFYRVCSDLVAQTNSEADVEELMRQYLADAERPKSGTRAIALLLQERQEDLDLTDEEFAKFCDTFRLSREELRNIYLGEEIESTQLGPLSRILGMTIDELIEVWKGKE